MPMEGLSQSYQNLKTKRNYFLSCDLWDISATFSLKNFKSIFHQCVVLWNYHKGIKMTKAGLFDGLTLRQALKFLPGLNDDILKLALSPIVIMTSMYWKELLDAPAEFVFSKIEK